MPPTTLGRGPAWWLLTAAGWLFLTGWLVYEYVDHVGRPEPDYRHEGNQDA